MARQKSQKPIQEQAANDLLHRRLEQFSRWAVPEIKWKLGDCAETPAANRLVRLLFKAARESSPDARLKELARRVLDAYDQVLDALIEYRTGLVDQGEDTPVFRDDRLGPALAQRLISQLKKLRRARPKDWEGLLRGMLANPEHEPELLTALWRAAVGQRQVRRRRQRGRKVIEVMLGGKWKRPTPAEPWDILLTREPARFLEIIDAAILAARLFKNDVDYVRRLREIGRRPTAKRLRRLFVDANARDENEAAALKYRFTVAGRRTGIFPDGLPSDFIDRVADRPSQMKVLVEAVVDQIRQTTKGSGRPEDRAIKKFADQVAAAYKRMTGKTIGYTKGSERAAAHKRGKVYGLAADIMVATLRLADASMGFSQAQVQIDRLRRKRPRW